MRDVIPRLILKYLISVPLPAIQSETWLVHAKVREPHLNRPVRMNFLPCALVFRKTPGKFIRFGGFRCGLRTFAQTSRVSDWIAGRGADYLCVVDSAT